MHLRKTKDWVESLKGKKIDGVEEIIKNYYVDNELNEEQIVMNCGNVTYNFRASFYLITYHLMLNHSIMGQLTFQ